MICKVCGKSPENKERFCPFCGSYFIDAESEDDGLEWKGIIRPDGTIEKTAKVTASNNYAPVSVSSQKVWGILAIIFSAIAFASNILGFVTDFATILLGLPCFIFAIVACIKAGNGKRRGIAMLFLFFSVMTFGIGLSNF